MIKHAIKIFCAVFVIFLTCNICLADETGLSTETTIPVAESAGSVAQEAALVAEETVTVNKDVVVVQENVSVVQEAAPAPKEVKSRLIEGIEILTGYGWSSINAKNDFELKRNYNFYPIYVDLDFNFKKITKKIGLNPPSAILFQLEPYIATVSSPNTNVEIGNSFMFKVGLAPETWKLQPYVKAGAGMVWMSQHTREQSTQFNFIETGVVGAQYYFKNNMSLLVEGRMRHLSNAGMRQPNHGINSYFAVAGVSYKY